nr:aldose 1-epimerase family protein [Cytophagales bacterium]
MKQITLSLANKVAGINLLGAELTSFKLNDQEYIWQANPAVWGRHAPILFPIVGKLRNNSFVYQGKAYLMGQHGFARDMEFSVVAQTASSVRLLLQSDENSRKIYPFDFELTVGYTLSEKGVEVSYDVKNVQAKNPMLFSIGAHPGFILPLGETERMEDYEINFFDSTLQSLALYPLVGGHVSKEKELLPVLNGVLPLRRDLFEQDALIMDVDSHTSISIRSKHSGKGVGMRYADFRWLGIWTKSPDSGFICIEPWNGIADTVDHDQQLENKWGIISLDAGEEYKVAYDIFFFE